MGKADGKSKALFPPPLERRMAGREAPASYFESIGYNQASRSDSFGKGT
jgi:hypothetical protein